MKSVILVLLSSLLSGCAALTSPKEQPVLEDKLGDRISTLAVTAERRLILVDRQKNNFCAEPSPDVAEALTSSLKTAAEASLKRAPTDEKSAMASLEVAKELTTSLSNLLVRTQGIQYMRDAMYTLCQAEMNGAFKNESDKDQGRREYQKRYDMILINAMALIQAELPLVEKRQLANAIQKAQTAQSMAKQAASESKAAANAAYEERVKAEKAATNTKKASQ